MPFRPVNDKQAQMIAGMTGQNPYTTSPQQPTIQIDQALQDQLYQKAMSDRLAHSAAQQRAQQNLEPLVQNIDPQLIQNPPARFQNLKKKIDNQHPINQADIHKAVGAIELSDDEDEQKKQIEEAGE